VKAAKAKSCRYLVNPAWATAAWRNCQSANSLASSLCENPLMPGKNKPLRKAEMARIQKCDNCRDEISGVQSRSFCSCKQNKKYTSMKIYRASSESPKIFEWRGFAHRSARWPMRRPVWRPGKKKTGETAGRAAGCSSRRSPSGWPTRLTVFRLRAGGPGGGRPSSRCPGIAAERNPQSIALCLTVEPVRPGRSGEPAREIGRNGC
jgi:hypothetical protein